MVFPQNIQTHALNIQTHCISASNGIRIIGSKVIERWQQNERLYRPLVCITVPYLSLSKVCAIQLNPTV